jgi:O-antigen ligase
LETVPATLRAENKKRRRAKGAYLALLVLSALYFARPEDVIPGLNVIPLAKIAGGIALLALILGLMSGKAKQKLGAETKLLLAFFAWYCITIPFAYWRSGALSTVMTRLSKGIIVALLVGMLVKEFWQLKRLIWVQAASIAFMTVMSVALHHTRNGRLTGVLGGVFENPNDLAINIALNWPLCVAFFFMARGIFKKAFWGASVLIMLLAVQMTYSRSGFLALAAACVLSLWHFAIRGRRLQLLFVAGVLGVVLLVATPGRYFARLASIAVKGETDATGEASREQRKQLLIDSVMTAVHHPVFGIGAGNFEAVNGVWRVAHNTYTEIAAEGGFPAFVLFLLVIAKTFVNIRRARKSPLHQEDKDMQILAGALWVSVASFLVGAFFASTEYSMYPYYLVAYAAALYRIACVTPDHALERRGVVVTAARNREDRLAAPVYAAATNGAVARGSSAGRETKWVYKWNPRIES